jgi:hypothetical protein
MSLVVLDSAVASKRANGGGARRVGIVGLAVLAAIALGADPIANAAPGTSPGTGWACLPDRYQRGWLRRQQRQPGGTGPGPRYLWPDGRRLESTEHGEAVLGGEPGAGRRRSLESLSATCARGTAKCTAHVKYIGPVHFSDTLN